MTVIGFCLAAVGLLLPAAYVWWLNRRALEPGAMPQPPPAWPALDVIVAVLDEAAYLDAKVVDILRQEYPGALALWIADGGSTDGTQERARAHALADPRVHLVGPIEGGKATQLNAALACSSAPYVLISDADARLAPDVAARLIAAASADARIGAIGVGHRPGQAHPVEHLHWGLVNRLRALEHRAGAGVFLSAPCYLIARDGFAGFAPDAAADDVHAAMATLVEKRTVAQVEALVIELRVPENWTALVRHKHRKAHAYVREIFRFVPTLGRMPARPRAAFLWRATLILGSPTLLIVGATLVAISWRGPIWPYLGTLVVVTLMSVLSSRLRELGALAAVLGSGVAVSLLRYPFSRPSSRWERLAAQPPSSSR